MWLLRAAQAPERQCDAWCRRQLLGASSMVKGEVAELRWSLQL